jgi:hypothetical protein
MATLTENLQQWADFAKTLPTEDVVQVVIMLTQVRNTSGLGNDRTWGLLEVFATELHNRGPASWRGTAIYTEENR